MSRRSWVTGQVLTTADLDREAERIWLEVVTPGTSNPTGPDQGKSTAKPASSPFGSLSTRQGTDR